MSGTPVFKSCGDVNLNANGANITGASGLTATGAGPWVFKGSQDASVQAVVSGTGTVAATINVEVSNDGVNALATVAGTITISGTNVASDGFVTQNASWKWIRFNVTVLSGTGATVTGFLGQ